MKGGIFLFKQICNTKIPVHWWVDMNIILSSSNYEVPVQSEISTQIRHIEIVNKTIKKSFVDNWIPSSLRTTVIVPMKPRNII
mmetsp:Transcript_20198/g.32744  ORF Transcript_20198/g.32744 Transcript_20198/m.32744 type:complete len:83 (+) Transcript_20198:163-411(+)